MRIEAIALFIANQTDRMTSDAQLPTYPVLRFVLARGPVIAWLSGSSIALLGLYGALFTGLWVLLVAGVGAGLLVGLLLTAFVELVRIIFDTLVPR